MGLRSCGVFVLETKVPIVLSVGLAVGIWTCYKLRCSAMICEASGQLPGGKVDGFLDGLKVFCSVSRLVGDQCEVRWWCSVSSTLVASQVLHRLELGSSWIDKDR